MKNKGILTIILATLSFSLSAQIITDRPDQTESSSTVTKGSLQIETGFFLGFTEANNITERQLLSPTTLFRYGLTKGIEIRIVSQFESLKTSDGNITDGISDLEVGAKLQLFQKEDVNTEIALVTHLIVPSGSKGLTIDSYGTVNKLAISHEINANVGFGYNVGYNYYGTGKGDLSYSVALGVGVGERAGLYIEPYGEIVEFEENVLNMDAGFTFLLKDNLQMDFSFGTGLTHTMNYIAVGLSWNIGSL